jgi:chromosome segregation ATPase
LLIFALSVFSAIAIGYAIPFLFNLYGFILLILILIALFFFGRAAISYGKSFHYSIKSFEDNVKNDLLKIENTLKDAEKNLSAKEKEDIRKAEQAANSIYNDAITALKDAEKEFHNILSNFMDEYEKFTTSLIYGYKGYLKDKKDNLSDAQKDALKKFIDNLMDRISKDKQEFENTLKEKNPDINKIPSIRQLHDYILREIWNLSVDYQHKQELGNILENAYNNSRSQYKQILDKIPEVIKALSSAKARLESLSSYEKSFNDIGLKVSKFLGVDGNKKYKVGFLNALRNLEDERKRMIASVDKEIHFLNQLRSFLY